MAGSTSLVHNWLLSVTKMGDPLADAASTDPAGLTAATALPVGKRIQETPAGNGGAMGPGRWPARPSIGLPGQINITPDEYHAVLVTRWADKRLRRRCAEGTGNGRLRSGTGSAAPENRGATCGYASQAGDWQAHCWPGG